MILDNAFKEMQKLRRTSRKRRWRRTRERVGEDRDGRRGRRRELTSWRSTDSISVQGQNCERISESSHNL